MVRVWVVGTGTHTHESGSGIQWIFHSRVRVLILENPSGTGWVRVQTFRVWVVYGLGEKKYGFHTQSNIIVVLLFQQNMKVKSVKSMGIVWGNSLCDDKEIEFVACTKCNHVLVFKKGKLTFLQCISTSA